MKKTLLVGGMFFIALLPSLVGIFHPGFFVSDDGGWMVIRLSAFFEALRQGQFPVRFLLRLNNGYGYPVSDFLYPLLLYIGSFIHIFHISFQSTIKILFAFSLFASAFGAFFWLRKHFNTVGAFVGALVYTLFPYHVWDISKRGSLGEVLAMGIVPFIFWQVDRGSEALTALGIGLLILSHNTLALLFLPVLLLYMLLEKKIRMAVLSLFFGLGISAFFWVSAIYDKQFTVFDIKTVSNFSQYFLSPELYALLGIISFVVIMLGLVRVFKNVNNRLVFFIVVSLLSIFFTTNASGIIWQIFHLGTYIQFPFRFLSLTALSVGFVAAEVIENWQKKYLLVFAGIVILLLFLSSWQFFLPHKYQYFPETYYSTNQDSTTVQNEYMPIWVKKLPTTQQQKISPSKPLSFQDISDKGSSVSFKTLATQSAIVTVATVYFPGWKALIDNKDAAITPSIPFGFISFKVPSGGHSVKVSFGETPIRILSDILSLVSLLVVFGMIFVTWTKQKK